jgi:hypothetical protein
MKGQITKSILNEQHLNVRWKVEAKLGVTKIEEEREGL